MLTAILSSMIYALPISFICAAQFFPLFCPEDASASPTLIALVVIAVCSAFRHGSLKVRLILAAVILALSAGIFFAVGKEQRAEFFSERTWILFVILIILAVYIVGELLSSLRFARIGAAVSIFALSLYLIIAGIDPGSVTTCMFLIMILSVVISEVQHYWKKEGKGSEQTHMVSILPFIILCALFVLASPSSDEPYGWPITRRFCEFVEDTVTKIKQYFSSDEDLMDVTIGFSSGDRKLTGDIDTSADSEEMFTVSFTRKDSPSINLAACGYNEFNGRGWTNSAAKEGIGRRHILDNIETRAALKRSQINSVTDHIRSIEVRVTYSNLNTRYTLLPSKYQDALSQGALLESRLDSDNTVFSDKRGFGTSYVFSDTMLNKNHVDFIDFMNGTREKIDPDTWYATVSDLLRMNKADCPYEEYLAYTDSIKETYYREVTVSPELRSKLDLLYEGAKSPYEKMLRLEALLSQFTYTTSPGVLPDSVNSLESFLDWFMLNNPKGYCSHFATAMVLLARAEGLPSRYVEGFAVPASSTGGTVVTDHNAHAWVEVYFEGFGFIPFDPTPGFNFGTAWQTSKERAEYMSGLSKGSIDAFINMDAVDSSEGQPEELLPEEETSPAFFLIPLLLIMLLFPAALLLYRLIAKRRFGRLSVTSKAAYMCHSNMKLLHFLGATPAPGETLSEFARREEKNYPNDLLDRFISLYEEISYSNKSVSDETLGSLTHIGKELCKAASAKRHIAFFFYRIFAA